MSSPISVLGIAGSLRQSSVNKALLRAAAELAPAGMTIESYDLTPLPFYDGDVEARGLPAPVVELRERIAAADALLFVTPEYNFSIPGVLKNAIDWASRPPSTPLEGKPAAITGAGGRLGTARAQYHLRQILLHSNMPVLIKPELFVIRAGQKFDAEGHLTDEETRQGLRDLLAALAVWTRRWRAAAAAVAD